MRALNALSQDKYSPTRYRMQFSLGPRVPEEFGDWQCVDLGESLQLAAHPDLNVEQAGNASASLTLIGYLLDPFDPSATNSDILDGLISSMEAGGDVLELVNPLGGRWVLVVNDSEGPRLLGDAAGLRQVFYSEPECTGELWCASQPGHIAKALKLDMDPEARAFIEWFQGESPESWWPGDSSPFEGVRRLLPNHYLALNDGKVYRFWPDKPRSHGEVDVVVGRVADKLTGMIQSAARRYDLAIAMSAGWDSRLMLAACKPVGKGLCYYTGKRPDMGWKHMDVRVPAKLLKTLGLPHDIIEHGSDVTPEFADAFNNNVLFAHASRMAPLQTELDYYRRRKVGVTGNVSEVARCYYRRPDEEGRAIDSKYLMRVTGIEHPFAEVYFDAWLEDAGQPGGYDILDLFYWEQRAGSWFSHNCLEFDLTWKEVFIPFNSRQLLEEMLTVDELLRSGPDFEFYCRLMKVLWPEVLSEPINPPPIRDRLHRYGRSLARRIRKIHGFYHGKEK